MSASDEDRYFANTKTQTVREALRDAMAAEMRRDDKVFLMGEEVAQYQGAYKISQGLLDEFGPRRVICRSPGRLVTHEIIAFVDAGGGHAQQLGVRGQTWGRLPVPAGRRGAVFPRGPFDDQPQVGLSVCGDDGVQGIGEFARADVRE